MDEITEYNIKADDTLLLQGSEPITLTSEQDLSAKNNQMPDISFKTLLPMLSVLIGVAVILGILCNITFTMIGR